MKATTAPDRAIRFGYRPDLLDSELAGWLDHIRWIAALAVAAGHLRTLIFPDADDIAMSLLVAPFYFLTLYGNQAVVIFFALSGLLVGGSVIRAFKGGRWDPGEMLFGTQDGSYAGTEVPDFYRDRSLFQPLRQVWFGDRRLPHVLQLTYHSDAPETGVIGFLGNTDRGVYSPDGMVVMGFGRGPDTEPLLRGPHTFTFGFASRTEVVSSATDE